MFDRIVHAMANYQVVLEPDQNTPEWWAGAPSILHDADGAFYLACRMREGNSPKGQRGYELRFLRSEEGRHFTPIHRITREDAGIPGFERPALVRDPQTGAYRLYACTDYGDGWRILRFDDADHPAAFNPATARVLNLANQPGHATPYVNGFKDPFVFWHKDAWRMFVIGLDRVERPYQFVSADGERWEPVAESPCLENTGWHNFYTRPACVLPLAVGFLLVYEGAHTTWHDANYNIATGIAYSPDLIRFMDLTPDAPLLTSTTPGPCHTWRYSHWLDIQGRIHVYFEAARPNLTNEIRLAVFDADYFNGLC